MTLLVHDLKLITDTLLSKVADEYVLSEALLSLKKLFSEAVAFDEMDTGNHQDIPTAAGMSIAPRWAASCLDDLMRTRKFLLGIKDAIVARLQLDPGKPVTLLYAGTGPFATLLTPLTTIFTPAQLQLVLVEINPVSVQFLEKTIQQFGMDDFIINVVEADAADWVISPHQQPDIIVSETMNNALQKEPQVSIAANLLSQCTRHPVLIPELIKVDVCIVGDTMMHPEMVISLKTLMELDAEMAVRIKNNPEKIPVLSKGIHVTVAGMPPPGYNQLVLCTFIKIYKQYSLDWNESGLTVPHILRMTASFKKYPVHLLFQYIIDSNPGFRFTEGRGDEY